MSYISGNISQKLNSTIKIKLSPRTLSRGRFISYSRYFTRMFRAANIEKDYYEMQSFDKTSVLQCHHLI